MIDGESALPRRHSIDRFGFRWLQNLAVVLACAGLAATPLEVAGYTLSLSWMDHADNETGFAIERSVNGAPFTELATVPANVVHFDDRNVEKGLGYSYRVRAFNELGFSNYTNVAGYGTGSPGAPSISNIPDQSVGENGSIGPIGFTVGDEETLPDDLEVVAFASGLLLVTDQGITLGGSGSNRTISIAPQQGMTGATEITILVSDGYQTVVESFVLTVGSAGGNEPFLIQTNDNLELGETITLRIPETSEVPVDVIWYFNGEVISGANGLELKIPSLQQFHEGVFEVQLIWASGSSSISSFEMFTEDPLIVGADVMSLSTRAWVGTGSDVLISGFVIKGTGTKRVLLRAVGPTLGEAPFSISGILENPTVLLSRWNGSGYVDHAFNQDWGSGDNVDELNAAMASLSAFSLPSNSRDAALLLDLPAGQYTLTTAGDERTTGISIVELYDADPDSSQASLASISNRGVVKAGNDVMISGFVIDGENPQSVLIRAVGPGLAEAPFNVQGTLDDPIVSLYRRESNGTDTLLFRNDNWGDNIDANQVALASQKIGAFPLSAGSLDSAVAVTLQPGIYTAVASGVGGASGVAIVEVYLVD